MNYILETERLVLRQFTIDDTKFIIELLNSPGWIEFIGDRNIKTEEQAKNYLQNGPIKSYEENGFGLSLVEIKNDRAPIGMCGIIKRDNLENPDIGFAFLPEFTGKGFAFEIANATMTFAKDKLKLSSIFAITVPNNKTSIKLLEKIGLKFSKTFKFPNDNVELMLFSNTLFCYQPGDSPILFGTHPSVINNLSKHKTMEYLQKTQPTHFKRYCKTLELQPDAQLIAEYKKVHAPGAAWPEITQGMQEVGILDMEIYLTGNCLFMIMDTVADFDHEQAMHALASKPRQSEWEAFVARFQKTSSSATAEEKWQLMERIYKLGE